MTSVRLATWNLLSGRSMDDGQVTPGRLETAAGSLDADVLAVQEVDVRQPRSGSTDQVAAVAQALGASYAAFAPALSGTPGSSDWTPSSRPPRVLGEDDGPDGPEYGIGLVSRLPVLSWHTKRLGTPRGGLPMPFPRPGRRLPQLVMVRDEPRVALAAVLDTPAGPLTVVSAHLSFQPWVSLRQLRDLARWATSLPGPRLLVGDLNLPPGLARRATGWHSLATAPTWPSRDPKRQLDHVLAEPGSGLAAADCETPALAVSDHRPLVVRVRRG